VARDSTTAQADGAGMPVLAGGTTAVDVEMDGRWTVAHLDGDEEGQASCTADR
jgi:hypothetical protein